MRTNKRMLSILLAVVMLIVLSLAACAPLATSVATLEGEPQVLEQVQAASSALQQPEAVPSNQGTIGAVAALEGTLQRIYEEVNPSVVHIRVVANGVSAHPEVPGFSLPQGQLPQQGQGTGFVWDEEGHIVTNNHVIDGAQKITVTFADGQVVDGEAIGTDPDSDLAVLKVDVPADQLHPVRMGDSTIAKVGELVIAIGNPFGEKGTMTLGIISALGRLLPVENGTLNRYNIPDVIQTDASINPGNSGGVLLNDQGEVVGVTTAILSPSQTSAGIGYAVPSVIVQKVVPVLLTEGSYEHPYLGISGTTLTPDLAEAMNLPADQRGALVGTVGEDSPAGEAGLQGSDTEVQIDGLTALVGGDVIIALNGQPITSMDDLITYLARHTAVEETVEVTVLRDSSETVIDVTLAARPASNAVTAVPQGQLPEGMPFEQQPFESQPMQNQAWMGINGLTLNPALLEALELPANQTGILVAEVVEDGPADTAGLRGGDNVATVEGQPVPLSGDIIIAVGGEDVEEMGDLRALLSVHEPGDEVLVTVLRDGEIVELTIELGEWPGE